MSKAKHIRSSAVRNLFFLLCISLLVNPFAVYGSSLKSVMPALDSEKANLQTYLENYSDASIFVSALKQSKYWLSLGSAARTIFVPTNDVLEAEGSAFLLQKVLITAENKERLNDVMALHMVDVELSSKEEAGTTIKVTTLGNNCLDLEYTSRALKISAFALATKMATTTDGVVYFIDRMLWESYDQPRAC